MKYTKEAITEKLQAYPRTVEKLKLLQYELSHIAKVSADEVLEAKAFGRARVVSRVMRKFLLAVWAWRRILCKRFSTKSRIFRRKYAQFGLLPLSTVLPGGPRRYARRNGVNAVAARRGILSQGN